MAFVIVAYIFLVFLSNSLLYNVDAQPPNRHDSFNVIKSLDNLSQVVEKFQTKLEEQSTMLKNVAAKAELQVSLLSNLHNLSAEVQAVSTAVAKLSEHFHNSVTSNGIVEGIIAGMFRGLVVIPFDSEDQTIISNEDIKGVAFDWNTRKVYWIEENLRIKRANLDGTSVELLVSGSRLRGLAVDPITGNFYYGILRPDQEIRVCSGSGKNCAVVASGADVLGDIYDMALYPSEGLIFWSNFKTNKTVTRANMDGTDARVIISEEIDIYGIYVDEVSRRLSFANDDVVVSYDLNGNNRKELLNATLGPSDVAVDGDTLYVGNWKGQSVSSHTQDGMFSSTSITASTTGMVRQIDFYGRNKVYSRPNPCKNSPCPNVCALNRESFTCL